MSRAVNDYILQNERRKRAAKQHPRKSQRCWETGGRAPVDILNEYSGWTGPRGSRKRLERPKEARDGRNRSYHWYAVDRSRFRTTETVSSGRATESSNGTATARPLIRWSENWTVSRFDSAAGKMIGVPGKG